VALHRKRRLLHWNRRQSSRETSSWISVQQRALPSCAGQGTPGRLTPTCPRPFPNVAASHAPVTRSLQLPRILSTISIQQLTMLLRFQCSKSTDNPKIYVSSAARQLRSRELRLGLRPDCGSVGQSGVLVWLERKVPLRNKQGQINGLQGIFRVVVLPIMRITNTSPYISVNPIVHHPRPARQPLAGL